MGDGPYRKAEQAPSRERVEAEERIAASERLLEPLAYAFLPPELCKRIANLRAAGAGDGATADVALIELAGALEEAVDAARIRELDLLPHAAGHPTGPSVTTLWGAVGTEEAATALLATVQALVAPIDPDAEVARTGLTLRAWMNVRGVPILWSVELAGDIEARFGGAVLAFVRSRHWIGIRASADLPKLSLRREGLADGVLKAIHVRRDVATGDGAFDAALFVEGNATFARTVLTPEVRAAVRARAGVSDFALWIDDGAASLEWTSNLLAGILTEERIVPSIEVLVALDGAMRALRLLRPE
jgi:hypothetical protein